MNADPDLVEKLGARLTFRTAGSKSLEPEVAARSILLRRVYKDRTEYVTDFVQGDGSGNNYGYHVFIMKDDRRSLGHFIANEKGRDPKKGIINKVLIDDRPDHLKITGIWLEGSTDWEMLIEANK